MHGIFTGRQRRQRQTKLLGLGMLQRCGRNLLAVCVPNLDAAEAIYRKILVSEPANPEAWKRLGNLEQAERKFDDSINSFNHVLARHPAYGDVNFLLGLSYYGKNDMDDAIASFNRELKTPTANLATRYYLALALQSKGQMDEAITQLQLSAKQNPNKSKVFYELARLYLDGAYRSIEQLKRIDSDSYELHALMGEFYSRGGSFELAAANYRAALKKNPDARLVAFVHAETSTGVQSDAKALVKVAHKHNALAIVDAVGSPDPTRSHFDAQDYMESGTPGRKATEQLLSRIKT